MTDGAPERHLLHVTPAVTTSVLKLKQLREVLHIDSGWEPTIARRPKNGDRYIVAPEGRLFLLKSHERTDPITEKTVIIPQAYVRTVNAADRPFFEALFTENPALGKKFVLVEQFEPIVASR